MTAKVHTMTGQAHATYNTRQAAFVCANSAASSSSANSRAPAATILPGPAARTISALLTLRDHAALAPILASVPDPPRHAATVPGPG